LFVSFSAEPIPLRVKPSRHFPFLSRHPWVHAHALADDGRDLPCGQVVDLQDHDGNWLARGVVNPASRLRVRLYAFSESVSIGEELWRERIDAAVARRRLCESFDRDAAERLVFSESDLLSGLIVDRYADCLGVQFTFGGLQRWREAILDHLKSSLHARVMMIRVDEKTAKYEGIEAEHRWHQDLAPDGPVAYVSNGLKLAVDLEGGQKTGGYLDQRVNQQVAARYLRGRRVLDVCCYTGGFGLVAANSGATFVQGIDSSQPALDAARQAAARNGLENVEFVREDCFDALKRLKQSGQVFEAVVLDPPRFAGSRHQIESALRAYRRLNSLAVDLLPMGGILVTCSCSGRVSRADFLGMLADVAKNRRRDLLLLENRGPAPDHPVAISCPETDYLKCLIVQVC
jgi:23S rRNA (cytosine1962-C5)-methyltransferase